MGKVGAKGNSYYGKVAANYQKRRAKQDWWPVEQAEMDALLSKLPDKLKVLDVPFGTGRFVPFYHDKNFDVTGLDVSADMLKAAEGELGEEDYGKCKTLTGSAMELPFPDGTFELVSSVRFIRDIIVKSDAEKALSEFARVTSKYAIIQLGQHTGAGTALDDLDDNVPFHSQLSASDNKKLLARYGLKILDMKKVKSDPADNSEIYHFLCEKA